MHSLDDLKTFVIIVDAGSVTAAAKRLNQPKSGVSRALSRLESSLQTKLLQRSTRSQQLTPSGAVLFEQSQPLLLQLEQATDNLSDQSQQLSGPLNLTFPQGVFGKELNLIALDFGTEYPNVELRISHHKSEALELDKHIDLAFVLHEDTLPSIDWNARSLMSVPQALYACKNCQDSTKLNWQQLAERNAITKQSETEWLFRQQGKLRQYPVHSTLAADDIALRRDAALRGFGIAKLPQFITRPDVAQGNLTMLHAPAPCAALQLTVLFRHKWMQTKAERFLSHFQNQIGRLASMI